MRDMKWGCRVLACASSLLEREMEEDKIEKGMRGRGGEGAGRGGGGGGWKGRGTSTHIYTTRVIA